MERLIGAAPFGAGLPTTVLSVPRRRGANLILTLLHYIPLRKALDIDVIEERMNFAGLELHLPAAAKFVRIYKENAPLNMKKSGAFELPVSPGRLLLEVPGFFSS